MLIDIGFNSYKSVQSPKQKFIIDQHQKLTKFNKVLKKIVGLFCYT